MVPAEGSFEDPCTAVLGADEGVCGECGMQGSSSGSGRAEDVLQARKCSEGGSGRSSRLRELVKPGWGVGGSEGAGFPGGCISVTITR